MLSVALWVLDMIGFNERAIDHEYLFPRDGDGVVSDGMFGIKLPFQIAGFCIHRKKPGGFGAQFREFVTRADLMIFILN